MTTYRIICLFKAFHWGSVDAYWSLCYPGWPLTISSAAWHPQRLVAGGHYQLDHSHAAMSDASKEDLSAALAAGKDAWWWLPGDHGGEWVGNLVVNGMVISGCTMDDVDWLVVNWLVVDFHNHQSPVIKIRSASTIAWEEGYSTCTCPPNIQLLVLHWYPITTVHGLSVKQCRSA